MRSVSRALFVWAVAGLVTGASGQITYPESAEPNDSKPQATIVPGLVHGDRITGLSRGITINGGINSPDYFRVSAAPLPLGIYRHQLDLVSTPVGGITSTLRGLDQTAAGAITAGTDVQVQNGVVNPTSIISNVWYGFGRGEMVYMRAQGVTNSPAYTFGFTTTPVTAIPVGEQFTSGPMSILVEGTFGNPDAEIWVYDASFNPVFNFNNDDPVVPMSAADRASFTRTFGPGRYYAVIGVANIANHLPSPSDELTPADDDTLDFAGAVTPPGGMTVSRFGNITVMDSVGVVTLEQEPITTTGRWYTFEVVSACSPVQFVFGPTAMSVSASQPVLMESLATGSDPIAYQWMKDGQAIAGATQASYSIAQATLGDAGMYTVIATNPCGQAETPGAQLDVLPFGPEITDQPDPQTLCIGGTAIFSVSATGHLGGEMSFQWRRDGVMLPLHQSQTLEFMVTSLADGGMYDCVVTEAGAGSTTSDAALLTVKNDPPAITLVGSETIVVQCGQPYVELGATATDDCDPVVDVVIGGDPVNTSVFGMYVVDYDATDSQGNPAATVHRYVHVVDASPPVVKIFNVVKLLWMPNYRLQNVGLKAWAADKGDPNVKPSSVKVRVFSDEPEVTGSGHTLHSPDAKNIAPCTLRLRRERRDGGDGRVYLIMGYATDNTGNTGYAFSVVICPQSISYKSIACAWAQAMAIKKKAETLAKTAASPQAVADGLKALGYCQHGKAPINGPWQ